MYFNILSGMIQIILDTPFGKQVFLRKQVFSVNFPASAFPEYREHAHFPAGNKTPFHQFRYFQGMRYLHLIVHNRRNY